MLEVVALRHTEEGRLLVVHRCKTSYFLIQKVTNTSRILRSSPANYVSTPTTRTKSEKRTYKASTSCTHSSLATNPLYMRYHSAWYRSEDVSCVIVLGYSTSNRQREAWSMQVHGLQTSLAPVASRRSRFGGSPCI